MNEFNDKILEISFDKNKIIKILNEKEIEKIKKKWRISLIFKLRRKFKIFLITLFKLFSFEKDIAYVRNRSLENVKNKYDKISGSYIENYLDSNSKFTAQINNHQVVEISGSKEDYYSQYLKNIIQKTDTKSFLEVGAGELTLAAAVLKNLKNNYLDYTGALDLSLNRLVVGNEFLKKQNLNIDYIVSGDASNLPFSDNCFDLVYTSHCLEQVPHLFVKAVNECSRVAKKYVVLIEPSYEFGSEVTKNHIYKKGYVKITSKLLNKLDLSIVYRNKSSVQTYINGSEIIILKKNINKQENNKKIQFLCPSCKSYLIKSEDKLTCTKENYYFDVISSIPKLNIFDKKRL